MLDAALAAGHPGPVCEDGVALARSGDKAEAERWFRRAADAGYAPAMNLFGDVLYERKEKDGARAWYERAAGA